MTPEPMQTRPPHLRRGSAALVDSCANAARAAAAALFAMILLAGCSASKSADHRASAQATVFDNVSLISMESDEVRSGWSVVVEGDRIAWTGPSDGLEIEDGATVVDGEGRYLLPGFSDVHVHMPTELLLRALGRSEIDPQALLYDEFLFLFVANGVTRIQIMSGNADTLRLRDEIEAGERLGPRMIVNTPMIDGDPPHWPVGMSYPVTTAEDAEAAVRKFQQEGYDRIKVYHRIPADAYAALLSAANEAGMPVDGHSPISVGGIPGALAAGQRLIAHSYDFIARTPEAERNRETMTGLADLWADHPDTWHTPTLVTSRRTVARAQDLEGLLEQPRYRYVHPATVRGLRETGAIASGAEPDESPVVEGLMRNYELQAFAVSQLNERGVTLMTATDVSFPPVVAGFDLHDELALLVEDAGLTPYQALKATTATPADYHQELDKSGTIAAGKRADLVLLGQNPLQDIAATRSIEGVMVRGRWLPREEIDARLAGIADYFETNRTALEEYKAPSGPPPSDGWDSRQ